MLVRFVDRMFKSVFRFEDAAISCSEMPPVALASSSNATRLRERDKGRCDPSAVSERTRTGTARLAQESADANHLTKSGPSWSSDSRHPAVLLDGPPELTAVDLRRTRRSISALRRWPAERSREPSSRRHCAGCGSSRAKASGTARQMSRAWRSAPRESPCTTVNDAPGQCARISFRAALTSTTSVKSRLPVTRIRTRASLLTIPPPPESPRRPGGRRRACPRRCRRSQLRPR
jgi:hypothetical protein